MRRVAMIGQIGQQNTEPRLKTPGDDPQIVTGSKEAMEQDDWWSVTKFQEGQTQGQFPCISPTPSMMTLGR